MEVKIKDQDEDNTFSSSDANGKVPLGQHLNFVMKPKRSLLIAAAASFFFLTDKNTFCLLGSWAS